jgi:hypothetical protein
MMAANAANDGSGRCQPKFTSDDGKDLHIFTRTGPFFST